MANPELGVVIPVYRNEDSLSALVSALEQVTHTLYRRSGGVIRTEVTFVVDGSPDNSEAVLRQVLPNAAFDSTLICHSRNFGSLAAVRTGLAHANADCYAVVAADLQEPPELLIQFAELLSSGTHDVAVGVRTTRNDPPWTTLMSRAFWYLYKSMINRDFPVGGVDVFACNRRVRDALIALTETNTSLIGQLYWLGFRRIEVPYQRQRRRHGKSSWTFSRKVSYMLDSVFAFTDLPIRVLGLIGFACIGLAAVWSVAIFAGKLLGNIDVSGFSALAIMVLLFGGVNATGISIAGAYAWRAYENSKGRPLSLTSCFQQFKCNTLEHPASGSPADPPLTGGS
jgi:glycosyltransferase involved in cell wall biosynthesis